MGKGIAPKRATHNTLRKLGGITAVPSADQVSTISQLYEISHSLKSRNTDPLKKLIEKQQSDGCTEHLVIPKFQTNQFPYDIVLFIKRIIKNIANICCTDRKEVKSALCWDFTLAIGKSPPYYLIALSYQNTKENDKTLSCYVGSRTYLLQKNEKAVKLLCDTLLDTSPRLATRIKVLGVDG